MTALAHGCLVRWANPEDAPLVAAIEQLCFPRPWSFDKVHKWLSTHSRWFIVVEVYGTIVGHACWSLMDSTYYLARIAVEPRVQGKGVGRSLLSSVKKHAMDTQCTSVDTLVSELDMDALMFFKACHFRATGLHRGLGQADEDMIEMRWKR